MSRKPGQSEAKSLLSRIALLRHDLRHFHLLTPVASLAVCVLLLPTLCTSANAQSTNPFLSSQPGYPNWSPFDDVKWENDRPVVLVNKKWYQLISIHGVSTDDILAKCKNEKWDTRRRIEEDIIQILRLMGKKIDKQTDLVLKDVNGQTVTLNNVIMTENRVTKAKEELLKAMAANAANNPFSSRSPGYPKWSAFTAIKWKQDQPIVEFQGQWYELVKFHGLTVDEIKTACNKNRWDFKHRTTEDLVQIVRLMGHKIDETTNLELRDARGTIVMFEKVIMSRENLSKLMTRARLLSRDQVVEDLKAFEHGLQAQFAYLKTNNVDYLSSIRRIADNLDEEVNGNLLSLELQKVIAEFIDGHAGVSGASSSFASGELPFLIAPSGDRFVAILPDRRGFVEKDYPFIESIDGIQLEKWIKATQKYIAKGSNQYRRRYGLRWLRSIQQFRLELGLESSGPLTVGLVNRSGDSKRSASLPVADSRSTYGMWPRVKKEPEILEGNIGYMRLPSMNDDAVELIKTWMPRFRKTNGLIVDVRDNGGGSRKALLELAGYLSSKDDTPRFGNVAKYRLAKEFDEDHLSKARYVYRETSSQFGDRERKAIQKFKANFKPQWNPPEDEFSQWHYMVFSKTADDPRFDYRKPVVILLNEGCYSATDIFLGAFKGWPRITLIGQPSGGGSARTQSFSLPNSRISIRCASMASFQPDGKLYDTNGVAPDIVVTRPPEYYLEGGGDVVLDKAISVLKATQKK